MTNDKLTNEHWEIFYHTLFTCARNEDELLAVCIPLAKMLENSGHMEEAQQYLLSKDN